jgi:predicted Zn-dependent peptidase
MTADAVLATLDNGIRVVVVPMPHVETASVSVFVRCGSQHESRRLNGISHVIEHMAFKGTRTRTCQQINLDAERLGADVNAHTDKDHTAFHMRGNARDAAAFVEMLGDIVQHGIFPEDELERERDVLLQEYTENEDDPMSTAFKLFDQACYGAHAAAQPVIGTRANISRFASADLAEFVRARHTGANAVVGVAGRVDADRIVAAARAAFGGMPRGEENLIDAPAFVGGVRSRRVPGDHVHVVLGFAAPPLAEEHEAFRVAEALFGEGMSSPLLDQLRERRGLVYHADCSTDVRDAYGQFVIEASTMPRHLEAVFVEVTRLLRKQTDAIDAVDLERARNQLAVRTLYGQEAPDTRLELAALDLFALGRVRSQDERLAAIAAVTRDQVRDTFAQMLAGGAAIGMAGKVSKGKVDAVARLALPGSSAGGSIPCAS